MSARRGDSGPDCSSARCCAEIVSGVCHVGRIKLTHHRHSQQLTTRLKAGSRAGAGTSLRGRNRRGCNGISRRASCDSVKTAMERCARFRPVRSRVVSRAQTPRSRRATSSARASPISRIGGKHDRKSEQLGCPGHREDVGHQHASVHRRDRADLYRLEVADQQRRVPGRQQVVFEGVANDLGGSHGGFPA